MVGEVTTELKNIVHMVFHLHAGTFIYDTQNLRTFSYHSTRNCSNFMVMFPLRSKVFGVFSTTPYCSRPHKPNSKVMYSSGFLFIC